MDTEPEILFEDNHLLVVNKPAGLLTQPSGTDQDSLEQRCKALIKQKYQKPGNVFLEAVHRLDKPASGIVVFARTSKALSRLNAAMRAKQSQKIYYALVEGVPQPAESNLEHYLVHNDFIAEVSSVKDPDAKLCKLHYRLLKQYEGISLLEVILETGRYHQIRAQLAAIGHPILGDVKYGSHHPFASDAIALHHISLEIPHPTKETLLQLKAPLPPTWNKRS
jgi:23S rRNA pseudouridine1911/1915/1917 synthase